MAKKKQLTIEEKLQNALVPKDEQPYKIPNNWCWSYWKYIAEIFSAKRIHKSDWKEEGIPFYRAREIVKLSQDGYVNNEIFISNEKYLEIKRISRLPKSGDLMVSGVGTIGASYVVKENDKFYYKDASVLCVSGYNKINAKYLNFYLKSPYMIKEMKKGSKGTTVDTLTINKFNNYLIVLPPISEQQRIVERIESLFAKLDRAKELIENTLAQWEQNKMAILHKAFIGELTAKWRKENKIDFTIVGMDDPLVGGIVDVFEAEGLKVFGPRKNAAILEGSKAFSKDLMKKYNIPTAAYENFTDPQAALAYLETAKMPIVLKADGLALGKGVLICNTLEEAKAGVKEIMEDKKFGTAGNTMVIEEFMTGREVSVLSFVDGKTIKIMSSAQDHKRAKDGDQGLNTGGMGNFSPSPFYTKEVDEFCKKYIYQATVDAMAAEGRPFTGVIFFGLMLTADGPRVLEYNARFGDPEAQVVLPRMKNDIIDVMEACVDGKLDAIDLQFEDNAAVCVVLASDGYPVAYEKGFEITGLEKFEGKEDYFCFHAGTKFNEAGKIVTNGGRVLGITATGADLKEARKKAYEATEWVNFANKYMRHDIGKAIDEA